MGWQIGGGGFNHKLSPFCDCHQKPYNKISKLEEPPGCSMQMWRFKIFWGHLSPEIKHHITKSGGWWHTLLDVANWWPFGLSARQSSQQAPVSGTPSPFPQQRWHPRTAQISQRQLLFSLLEGSSKWHLALCLCHTPSCPDDKSQTAILGEGGESFSQFSDEDLLPPRRPLSGDGWHSRQNQNAGPLKPLLTICKKNPVPFPPNFAGKSNNSILVSLSAASWKTQSANHAKLISLLLSNSNWKIHFALTFAKLASPEEILPTLMKSCV